jgi:hypothetical protein
VRWIRIAVFIFAASPFARHYGSVPWRSIAARLPSGALLFAEHHLGERTPYTITRELRQRTEQWELSDENLDWMIRLLIRDLKADATPSNARRAMQLLHSLNDLSAPALHTALHSNDWQQRQAAACVLRKLNCGRPSDDLIRVSIKGFRGPPASQRRDDWWVTASHPAEWFLVEHQQFAEQQLLAGLDSTNERERLHCAAVLAHSRRLEHLQRIVPVLAEHLKDNQTRWDASKAEHALAHLGMDVIEMLEPLRDSADAQQRERVALIMKRVGRHESQAVD